MANRRMSYPSVSLAGSLGVLLLAILPAAGQQPGAGRDAPSAAPLPPPLIGRPNNENAMKLAPVSAPPSAAKLEDLPTARLKVPRGFKVETLISGIADARTLRIGDKGTVFVSNRFRDKVYAVVNKNGTWEAKIIASGLDRPNGLAFHNGTLYIAEGTKISKLEKIEDNLDNPPKIGRASCRERV